MVGLAALFVLQINVFNNWSELNRFIWLRTGFNIGLAALIFAPALIFRRRHYRLLYLLGVEILLAVVLISQYLYFAYSGSFLQSSVVRYALYAGDVASSIKTLPLGPLYFLGIGVVVLALAAYLDRQRPPVHYPAKWVLTAAMGLFVLGLGLVSLADYRRFGDVSRIFNNPYDNASLIEKVGVVGYGALDLRRYLATPRGISPEEKEFVKLWGESNPIEQTDDRYLGLTGRKNLIIVQSESLERFVIGRQVGGQEITPNINRFARQSLYFPNFYYTIGPGHTVDAELVIGNSLLPLQDRVAFFEYPNHDYYTLAETFGAAGYYPLAMHANSGSFWNRTTAYPEQGFKKFFSKNDFGPGETIGWGLGDTDFFAQAATKLKSTPKPFYAHLISLTQHVPFDLPPEHQKLQIDEELGLDWIQENYLQISHYYDAAFGRFISELKSAGLYDNSVIVLVGDHTAFLEKPNDLNFAKFLGLPNGFDRLSYIQNTQVPFMIHVPGGPSGNIDTPGGHLDVFPTLANLFGISPPGSILGRDLLNTSSPLGISLRFNTKLIDALEGKDLIYVSSEAGSFETGSCLHRRSKEPVETSLCRPMYQDAEARLKISELLIRGNAVGLLNNR